MTYRHPNYNLREALTAGVNESYAEKILKKGVSRLQFDLTIMGKKCWIHFFPERYEHIILPEADSEEAAVEILMKILDEYEDFDSRYKSMNGGLEDFWCRGWTKSLDDKRINRIKEIGINVKTNGKYWWVTAGKKICQICDNKDSAQYHADILKRELIMLSNDEVIKSDIKEELSISGKLNEWQSVDEVMKKMRPESLLLFLCQLKMWLRQVLALVADITLHGLYTITVSVPVKDCLRLHPLLYHIPLANA